MDFNYEPLEIPVLIKEIDKYHDAVKKHSQNTT